MSSMSSIDERCEIEMINTSLTGATENLDAVRKITEFVELIKKLDSFHAGGIFSVHVRMITQMIALVMSGNSKIIADVMKIIDIETLNVFGYTINLFAKTMTCFTPQFMINGGPFDVLEFDNLMADMRKFYTARPKTYEGLMSMIETLKNMWVKAQMIKCGISEDTARWMVERKDYKYFSK